jgi:hypothetical protein
VNHVFKRLFEVVSVFASRPVPVVIWILVAKRIAVMDLGFLDEALDVDSSDVVHVFLGRRARRCEGWPAPHCKNRAMQLDWSSSGGKCGRRVGLQKREKGEYGGKNPRVRLREGTSLLTSRILIQQT